MAIFGRSDKNKPPEKVAEKVASGESAKPSGDRFWSSALSKTRSEEPAFEPEDLQREEFSSTPVSLLEDEQRFPVLAEIISPAELRTDDDQITPNLSRVVHEKRRSLKPHLVIVVEYQDQYFGIIFDMLSPELGLTIADKRRSWIDTLTGYHNWLGQEDKKQAWLKKTTIIPGIPLPADNLMVALYFTSREKNLAKTLPHQCEPLGLTAPLYFAEGIDEIIKNPLKCWYGCSPHSPLFKIKNSARNTSG